MRVEDTDLARSTDESTQSILDGLKWLGFEPDEEIVFQSNNAEKHRQIALKLLEEGKAYRDFTPKENRSDKNIKKEIAEKARKQGDKKDMRDNPYRNLSKEESDEKAKSGESFAVRLKVAETGKTSFEDAVYGLQEREYSEIEDLVLLRSDSHPLYNLAVVCDDLDMEISHAIRGQDHLTNTHKQILIYEALGKEKPVFAHLPLILAPGGKKLSKRTHGEIVSMDLYREKGFIAEAFRNFLALLGWSPYANQKGAELVEKQLENTKFVGELMSLDDLVDNFSLENVNRSPATFNFDSNNPKRWTDEKAIQLNAHYIRTLPLDTLIPLIREELEEAKLWRDEYADEDKEWFEGTINLIRERFYTLKDFSQQGRAFFSEDFDYNEKAITKNLKKHPDLREWLPELASRFETVEDWSHDPIHAVVKQFCADKETKFGVVLNGARVLLTGQAVGPSMLAAMEQLGKEKTIMRLKSQIAWDE